MRYLKIVTICITSYFIVALINNDFLSFSENFGSIWLNVKYFYMFPIGILLLLIFNNFNKLSRIFSFIFGFILFLVLIDSPNSLKYHELSLFIFLNSLFFQFSLSIKFFKR